MDYVGGTKEAIALLNRLEKAGCLISVYTKEHIDDLSDEGLIAESYEALIAQHGEDLHALKAEEHHLAVFSADLPIEWGDPLIAQRRVLLFSDRQVYRPGETVHLKALARVWRHGRLTWPAGAIVSPEAAQGQLARRLRGGEPVPPDPAHADLTKGPWRGELRWLDARERVRIMPAHTPLEAVQLALEEINKVQ